MVDYYGNWTAEKDYKVFPKEKWCDYDYIAAWIQDLDYKPKTSIENLVTMVMAHYTSYLIDEDIEFFIEEKQESENGLMISIEDVSCFVDASGGLKEFDYYC